jgi:hypothetical protein
LLTYLIILSVTMAGMMQAPWWSAVAGACILMILPIAERSAPSTSPAGVDDERDEPIATMADLINGSVAATAAFLLGRATAWLWGL